MRCCYNLSQHFCFKFTPWLYFLFGGKLRRSFIFHAHNVRHVHICERQRSCLSLTTALIFPLFIINVHLQVGYCDPRGPRALFLALRTPFLLLTGYCDLRAPRALFLLLQSHCGMRAPRTPFLWTGISRLPWEHRKNPPISIGRVLWSGNIENPLSLASAGYCESIEIPLPLALAGYCDMRASRTPFLQVTVIW